MQTYDVEAHFLQYDAVDWSMQQHTYNTQLFKIKMTYIGFTYQNYLMI